MQAESSTHQLQLVLQFSNTFYLTEWLQKHSSNIYFTDKVEILTCLNLRFGKHLISFSECCTEAASQKYEVIQLQTTTSIQLKVLI